MSRKLKLGLASAFSILALSGTAMAEQTNFMIVNGVPEHDIDNIPWQVALLRGPAVVRDQFCGGSIVDANWVLTAAHCVENRLPESVDVLGGTVKLSHGGQRVDVAQIMLHPKWGTTAKSLDYDAALLRLAEPLAVGSPIQLADASTPLDDGNGLLVSGWGAIHENGPSTNQLQYVEVPVYNQQQCVQDVGASLTDNMLCAGFVGGGSNSCQGDSGGPLFTIENPISDTRLAGIVSWGYGCARPNLPGVYTRVTVVADWVNQTIQAQ